MLRLVVLIREICNDLIRATKWHVGVEDLLIIEPDDAVKRLARTLTICGHFKNCYFHYKSKAAKVCRPLRASCCVSCAGCCALLCPQVQA